MRLVLTILLTLMLSMQPALASKKHKHKNNDFQTYSKDVRRQTERNYRKEKNRIDPGNLRGRSHSMDLDHKMSVKSCFNHGVSAKDCAKSDNLQLLDSHKNRSLGCKEAGCKTR